MIVGSKCINKFVEQLEKEKIYLFDEEDKIVTKERIKQDIKNYFKKITLELIEEQWKNHKTDYRNAVINNIENNKALTCNMLKHLEDIYLYGESKNPRYVTAMKNTIKVSFKKNVHKNQYYELNENQRQFVYMFLSSSQRQSL